MKELLDLAANDVVELLTKGISNLKEIPQEKWGLNEVRALEVYNKIINICLARSGDKKTNKFEKISDEELENGF
jgi:hypothetical protein